MQEARKSRKFPRSRRVSISLRDDQRSAAMRVARALDMPAAFLLFLALEQFLLQLDLSQLDKVAAELRERFQLGDMVCGKCGAAVRITRGGWRHTLPGACGHVGSIAHTIREIRAA